MLAGVFTRHTTQQRKSKTILSYASQNNCIAQRILLFVSDTRTSFFLYSIYQTAICINIGQIDWVCKKFSFGGNCHFIRQLSTFIIVNINSILHDIVPFISISHTRYIYKNFNFTLSFTSPAVPDVRIETELPLSTLFHFILCQTNLLHGIV